MQNTNIDINKTMWVGILCSIERVWFVCTGNTCRSPMAEVLFRKLAQNAGWTLKSLLPACTQLRSSASSGANEPYGSGESVSMTTGLVARKRCDWTGRSRADYDSPSSHLLWPNIRILKGVVLKSFVGHPRILMLRIRSAAVTVITCRPRRKSMTLLPLLIQKLENENRLEMVMKRGGRL